MQVNLLYLETVHGDLTDQRAEKRTRPGLKVVTSAARKPAIGHTCALLTRHRKKLQGKFILKGKGKKLNAANMCLGMSEDGSLQFHTADTLAVIKKTVCPFVLQKKPTSNDPELTLLKASGFETIHCCCFPFFCEGQDVLAIKFPILTHAEKNSVHWKIAYKQER